MSVKQLLIFDSGVGGLSIFQELIKQSDNIHCYYLSDNAYFPYGELDESTLINRLILLLSDFIKQHSVDMILIACNSASTVALKSLRAHFSMPIIGVVPAIKPACLNTKSGVIGLVATPATIKRDYTNALIKEFASDKMVLKIGTTALVKLAEETLQGKMVDKSLLQSIFQPWLEEKIKPDTLVLGCTHFPLLKAEINDCFAGSVKLVDSGEAIAKRITLLLAAGENKQSVRYDAFYTLQNKQQLSLEDTFMNMGFHSFSLFSRAVASRTYLL